MARIPRREKGCPHEAGDQHAGLRRWSGAGKRGQDETRGAKCSISSVGDWARPLFDDEALAFLGEFYQRADAFLFGRRTYKLFADYWGVMALGSGPIADSMNTRPK
jgi:hypothetical protein